jgi:hypothetical protein
MTTTDAIIATAAEYGFTPDPELPPPLVAQQRQGLLLPVVLVQEPPQQAALVVVTQHSVELPQVPAQVAAQAARAQAQVVVAQEPEPDLVWVLALVADLRCKGRINTVVLKT